MIKLGSQSSSSTINGNSKKQAFRVATENGSAHNGAHILIVEGDPALQEMLRYMLELSGYRTSIWDMQTVDSAKEQTRRLNDPPDLVLLDLDTLSTNHRLFLQQFRALWKNPPFVMLTVDMTMRDKLLGVERVLPKPFRLADLRSEMSQALASV